MKKIAMKVDELRVQSFPTTSTLAPAHLPGDPETWEDVLTCAGGCDEPPSGRCDGL